MARVEYHRFNPDRCTKYLITLVWVSVLIYIGNRWIITPHIEQAHFLRSYVGDILALPVYLPLSYFLAVKLGIIPPDFRFGFVHLVAVVLIFGLIFEGIVPMILTSSTRDYGDIIAYFSGGLLVYGISSLCVRESANNEGGQKL